MNILVGVRTGLCMGNARARAMSGLSVYEQIFAVRNPATRMLTRGSGADDLELNVDVAARRVRIRADLLVRLVGQRRELRLGHRLVRDGELHREAEADALARADRHGALDARLGGVDLLLLGDEVERAAEARRIAGREQMLGCGRAGLARAAHHLRHRQLDLDRAVRGLGMAVAPADGGRGGGEQRLDLVHGRISWGWYGQTGPEHRPARPRSL